MGHDHRHEPEAWKARKANARRELIVVIVMASLGAACALAALSVVAR